MPIAERGKPADGRRAQTPDCMVPCLASILGERPEQDTRRVAAGADMSF
jgi:hypothetical protein